MEQRLPFYMQINIIRMRLNLIKDIREIIYFDEIGLTFRLRTERAGQITDACNFNIKFLELLHTPYTPILF